MVFFVILLSGILCLALDLSGAIEHRGVYWAIGVITGVIAVNVVITLH